MGTGPVCEVAKCVLPAFQLANTSLTLSHVPINILVNYMIIGHTACHFKLDAMQISQTAWSYDEKSYHGSTSQAAIILNPHGKHLERKSHALVRDRFILRTCIWRV